jgi:hypothetical protein
MHDDALNVSPSPDNALQKMEKSWDPWGEHQHFDVAIIED